jgi:hypothetical protein
MKKDSNEVMIIMHLLDVTRSTQQIISMWDMPPDLEKYFRFVTSNSDRMIADFEAIETIANSEEKSKAWRRNRFSTIRQGIMFSIDALTKATAVMIWRALLVGRFVNRLRKSLELSTVSFIKSAEELDQEFGGELDAYQEKAEDWEPGV